MSNELAGYCTLTETITYDEISSLKCKKRDEICGEVFLSPLRPL